MNARYQIIGPIAEGGLGEVFRGWDSHLGREVAVKKVRKNREDSDTKGSLAELVKEARTLSTLQHPNVVTVYDVGVEEEGAFIVMELVKGETLEDIVTRGALTQRDFDTLVNQSLEGMIAAHAAGLIHLDLKPQNLMITWLPSGSFQVKILDFGLAMAAVQPVLQETDSDGSILGSIFFMAPEQFERGAVDSRTDLYSLGCIFYYALTGQYPFQGESAAQVMTAHLYHRLPPLKQLRPDLPAYIPDWVEWLQSRVADDRPSSTALALKAYREKRVPRAAPIPVAEMVSDDHRLKRDLMPKGLLGEQGKVTAQGGGHPSAVVRPRPAAGSAHTVSRLSRYTIPVLALLTIIAGAWFWLRKRNLAIKAQRFAELAQQEVPDASADDVRLLLAYANDPETSPAASLALGRLRGGAEVDGAILRAAQDAKTRPANINLLKVVAMREINGGLDLAWRRLDDDDAEVQKAAWDVVSSLATSAAIPDLLDRAENLPEPLVKHAEAALVSIVQRAKDSDAAAAPIVNAYQGGLGPEGYRAMLVRVLGQSGGRGALTQLQRALENKSVGVRKAAISSLARWPDSQPLQMFAEKFEPESDAAARILMLMASEQLVAQPGAFSQEKVFEFARSLYEAARDHREKDQAFKVLARVESKLTIAYLEELAQKEEKRRPLIEAILGKLQDRVAQIVAMEGDKVVLPADMADYNGATSLTFAKGVLQNWESPTDWAGWLVTIPAPGRVKVRIEQASDASEPGSYEILIAGAKLATQSVKTGGREQFKEFEVGTVEIKEAGTYRLTLRAMQIPTGESLFVLKSVILKAE